MQNLIKRAVLTGMASLYALLLFAQPNVRTYVSTAALPQGGIKVNTTDGALLFRPHSTHTMEVTLELPGRTNPPSHALAGTTNAPVTRFTETTDSLHFHTNGVGVHIQKTPFRIRYSYNDLSLLSEEAGFMRTDSTTGFRFELQPTEKLMGGGERALGMNRRGHRLTLYNQPSYGYEEERDLMYYSMPIAISSKKYMLVFDNGATGYLDLGATEPDILQMEATGGRMSYLLVAADNWPDLITHFTELTGRQSMLPRWAYGNITSRMGYHSQQQAEKVVDAYLKQDIPLDGIVFDLYWFGKELKGTLGNLEWFRDSFPEPEQMMQDFSRKGINTILITEPFILKNTNYYKAVTEKGLVGKDTAGNPYHFDFYFGNGTLVDVFNPAAQDWFWQIYKKHTLSGVAGWWGDLGEPEAHPDDLLHVNGRADEVHNLYGHNWAKLVYEGFRRDFPERRPVILMRSGFVGSQRYGMLPWSGDVSRSWGGLKPQVEIALQMGLQGMAYMSSDLGGFAGDYKDPELYIRWLQYGVFQPVYRTHAQEGTPPEPVFWDETTKAVVRDFIKLRYQLLPYQYTLAYENATKGLPMMRPLFYAEDKPELIDDKQTYLWGDAFLVSPVTDKGARTQQLYLPAGAHWINYWTNEAYVGGQTIEIEAPLEQIPLLVKAGSFIPMVPAVQSTQDYSTEKLKLHYYHHPLVEKGSGYLYEDDGKTIHAWQKEQYERLSFKAEWMEKVLSVSLTPSGGTYEGKPDSRFITLAVHAEQPAQKVYLNGKRIRSVSWDAEQKVQLVEFEQRDKSSMLRLLYR